MQQGHRSKDLFKLNDAAIIIAQSPKLNIPQRQKTFIKGFGVGMLRCNSITDKNKYGPINHANEHLKTTSLFLKNMKKSKEKVTRNSIQRQDK